MKRTILLVFVLVLTPVLKITKADYILSEPENLGPPVNTSSSDQCPSITTDGLELYFTSGRSGSYSSRDIWVARRSRTDDPWGEPVNLGPIVNSSSPQWVGCISSDGLSLYFNSNRSGGYGGSWGDIWMTTRATRDDTWSQPVNLGPMVNSSYNDIAPCISTDGLSLLFASNRPGGYGNSDIWITTRANTNDPWTEPVNLGPIVNSSAHDICGYTSADDRMLILNGYEAAPFRPGGYGGSDLWITTRATISHSWSTPVNLGPILNSSTIDGQPSISADGSTIFFMSTRTGGLGSHDLWQAQIIPVVDFNDDEIVDGRDISIMVDHWGEDYPLCDIGPMPWGDGIVDVKDLVVLAAHLFEEVLPDDLVAYWKFDEIDGDIAYDSAGSNFGTLSGNPIWQSDSGQEAGALQFDGLDDYISTAKVLNPKFAEFSVFAWIKGGSPGQVIISQKNSFGGVGATWLGIDPVNGCLMTGLVSTPIGRFIAEPLESNHIITDDIWHHVGFVWDGSSRTLYVDGIEVAKDTNILTSLNNSDGGLYIGVNKNLDAATYFSGLIDDVRIYNKVLTVEEITALTE